ncbi:MAG: FAD:protein FMN transferase [Bacteroidaceae bacterium]|nr:FAD:protein FMN transferase [Bacteroidaceae bacterium]
MDKKKIKILLQTLFLLFLIAGTYYAAITRDDTVDKGNGTEEGCGRFRKTEDVVFGTVMHTTYQSKRDLHKEIMDAVYGVDASLSMFNPKSTLARINSGKDMHTDSLLTRVFTLAQQISGATDGAFDITVAPLVNAWGFGFKSGSLPDEAQVDSLRELVNWKRISLKDGVFVKEDERMVMDMSAIAKGFGSDMVAEVLKKHGVKNFMVEIGGEIVTAGNNPNGKAWVIGINRPVEDSTSQNNEIQKTMEVHESAMATSGNYRNFYITKDGRKVAHTIDPKTGYPVQHSILSSTVLAPSCAMADGYATGFMVMGLEKAQKVLKAHPELKAYFIYADEKGNYRTWTNIE